MKLDLKTRPDRVLTCCKIEPLLYILTSVLLLHTLNAAPFFMLFGHFCKIRMQKWQTTKQNWAYFCLITQTPGQNKNAGLAPFAYKTGENTISDKKLGRVLIQWTPHPSIGNYQDSRVSIIFWTCAVYFNQLSGACSTWKLVELLFLAVFNLFNLLNLFQWFHC